MNANMYKNINQNMCLRLKLLGRITTLLMTLNTESDIFIDTSFSSVAFLADTLKCNI